MTRGADDEDEDELLDDDDDEEEDELFDPVIACTTGEDDPVPGDGDGREVGAGVGDGAGVGSGSSNPGGRIEVGPASASVELAASSVPAIQVARFTNFLPALRSLL